jgi:hypothetical protein
MPNLIDQLVERISQACRAKSDSSSIIEQWASQPIPLSVWDTWTLLTLVRHRRRQQFVAATIRYRLNAELKRMAVAGAMGHPDCPRSGLVPGMTDWEYYFHGRGCCLTHRITGESIDVDFFDETADWFDSYFFEKYLESLKAPEFAELRLIELHRTRRTVVLSFDVLLQAGLLEKYPDRGGKRLAFESEALAELLDQAEQTWKDLHRRVFVAAAIGDWYVVAEHCENDELRQLAASLVREAEMQRSAMLELRFQNDDKRTEALEGLSDLGSPMLPEYLKSALQGPPSGTTSAALKVIAASEDATWCRPVHSLWIQVDPGGPLPNPYIWVTCAELLLRRGHRVDEVCRQLQKADAQTLGEAALLALEYAPEYALTLFRRALRSEIPINRIVAASVLAILDQPWSRREMLRVLEESTDQLASAECRSALMETHDDEAHQVVTRWEEVNPREPEHGRWITVDEFMLRNNSETIRWEMEERHDRVMQLKGRVPPDA